MLKASTYDRELYAIYESVKYFRDFLEGRTFCIYTDHKPLVTAFHQRPERANPTQQRRLAFISEYSTDIRHIPGNENNVADMLSRIEAVSSDSIDYEKMAELQRMDNDIQKFIRNPPQSSSIVLKELELPSKKGTLYCDVSTQEIRPLVPEALRAHVIKNYMVFLIPAFELPRISFHNATFGQP